MDKLKKSFFKLFALIILLAPAVSFADPAGTQNIPAGGYVGISGSFKYGEDGFSKIAGVVDGTDGEVYVFYKQSWTANSRIWYSAAERGKTSQYFYISVSADNPYSGQLSHVKVSANGTPTALEGPSVTTINKYTASINTTDNSASSTSSDNSTSAPKAQEQITTGKVNEEALPSIDATKNCSTGKFENGILKGLSCNGPVKNLSDVTTIIKNIVFNFMMPAVGVLFLIIMIVGGILYISSAGNQTQIDRAKKTLTAGVIGLLIVISSYAIIRVAISLMGGGVS